MAMNNPHPWVMPSVASANGFGQNTGFDPTNPARQKRRPSVAADDGGIGGAINAGNGTVLKSPASAVAGDDGSLAAVGNRLKTAYGFDFSAPTNGNTAPPAAPVSPLQLAQSARATASPLLRRGEYFPTSIDQAPSAAPTTVASGDGGGIPATPPALKSPTAANAIPKVLPLNPATAADLRAINPNGIPATPSYETGVTLPGGRTLPIGAMVNGVPTFSDGTNGIARTMPDTEIKGLGAQLPTVPAGTAPVGFASPAAFNSDNSEANIAAYMRANQGSRFGITPEMNAAADLAAIENRDPRSTLGRAALNLQRSANAAPTVLQRKSDLAALGGMDDAAARNFLAPNTLANTLAEGGNALQRAQLAGQYNLAGIGDRNQAELASADLAGRYRVAAAQAKPNARTMLDPNRVNSDAVTLIHNSPQLLGLDSLGNVIDATTGKARAPTAQESAAIMARARQLAAGETPASSASAYPEGTRLHGPDGKLYVVKNGQPVLAQ